MGAAKTTLVLALLPPTTYIQPPTAIPSHEPPKVTFAFVVGQDALS